MTRQKQDMTDLNTLDPRGLMGDAYDMDTIGPAECRSIFLDWALGIPADQTLRPMIAQLLDHYGARNHPMTDVLRAGIEDASPPRRRGGRAGRLS